MLGTQLGLISIGGSVFLGWPLFLFFGIMKCMKILDAIKEHKILSMIIGIFIGLICPIGLNYLCWIHNWASETVVGYYGTILGAIATILALVCTIDYSRKQSQESFRQAQILEYRNRVLNICDDLAELCNPICLQNIQEKVKSDVKQFDNEIRKTVEEVLLEQEIKTYIINTYLNYNRLLRFGVSKEFLNTYPVKDYVESLDKYFNCMRRGDEYGENIIERYQDFLFDIGKLPDIIVAKNLSDTEKL